jgi:hypothetical protein
MDYEKAYTDALIAIELLFWITIGTIMIIKEKRKR